MMRLELTLVSAVLLAGCQYQQPKVWTDAGTRCDYIVARGNRSTAITPRLDASGRQVCARALTLQH